MVTYQNLTRTLPKTYQILTKIRDFSCDFILDIYGEQLEAYREQLEAYCEQLEAYREQLEAYREQLEAYRKRIESSGSLTSKQLVSN